MRKTTILLVLTLYSIFLLAPPDGDATEPAVDGLLSKMKNAFEPSMTSTRIVTITLKSHGAVTSQWVAQEARKTLSDGKKSLLVIFQPECMKGVARLISEKDGTTNAEFIYFPALHRIREFHPIMGSDLFLNTDFTYADLGFIKTDGITKYLGSEDHAGIKAFKMETLPDNHCYYSRIVSWVSCKNYLPLQRDYYDAADRLWKTQSFEEVVVINDIPTPLLIRMVDHLNDTSTDYKISEVCYGANVPDEVFEIKRLLKCLESSFCVVEHAGE